MIERMFATAESIGKRRREADIAEAEWLLELSDYDRSGDWAIDGYLNAAAALRTLCRMDPGVAQYYVHLARKLAKLPEVAAAYAAGDISLRHVQVVADAYTNPRAEAIAACESTLVDVAREHTPKALAAVVKHLADAIDGDDGAGNDEDEFRNRSLYASKTLHGRGDLRGSCDPLTFEVIDQALNAEMARDLQANDPRLAPARRMDALTNICRRALDGGELGESHGVQPHITAVVHIDPTAEPGARIRAEFADGRHLSTNQLELLLCDCDLSRVIVAGRSEILDVGRTTPIATPAQWKALVVRDGHCQAPGCRRPPSDCQAHHRDHYTRGGRTDLDNLELLCWYHHRIRHVEDAKARARPGEAVVHVRSNRKGTTKDGIPPPTSASHSVS